MIRQVLAGVGVCAVLASCGPKAPAFDLTDTRLPDAGDLPTRPIAVRAPVFVDTSNGRIPPPISGGTLAVLRDGHTAVAADTDSDAVWIADLVALSSRRVALEMGDEPGRVVEGPAGTVFVALRRADSVAVIDVASASVSARRSACHAPRGLAWDAPTGLLSVACADGTLMMLGAAGEVRARMYVTPDLRDVVMVRGDLYVTTLRSASLYRLRGSLFERLPTPGSTLLRRASRDSAVAWRTLSANGRIVMLAQHARASEIDDATSGVGYSFTDPVTGEGMVMPGVAFFDPNAPGASADPSASDLSLALMPRGGLAVDVAVSSSPAQFAVASPGWAFGQGPAQVSVFAVPAASTGRADLAGPSRSLSIGVAQAVAVAFDAQGLVVAQTRAPAGLVMERSDHTTLRVVFSDDDHRNLGHDTFHAATPSGFACATCHPEGGDDGRTWRYHNAGAHRTLALGGDVTQTAPFRWDGSLLDMRMLVSVVFTQGMSGGRLPFAQIDSLSRWIDATPAGLSRPRGDASERGEMLFNSPALGCAQCHRGPQHSDSTTVDVGTGEALQVPRLVGLATRAPFMHLGCAATLRAIFTDPDCGGGDRHGRTSQLSSAQLDDLVAYLETL